MIGSGAAIPEFLARVDAASAAAAAVEYAQLLERLRREVPDADERDDRRLLVPARRAQARGATTSTPQLVRSYFPFERVLPGVLDTTGRLLDLRVRAGR